MKKQLVKGLVLVLLCVSMLNSGLLLAQNIKLQSKLDEAETLLIEAHDEMLDVMSDESLARLYLSEEHDIYDCSIVLGEEDYDEMVEIMAFDGEEILHCGSFNRDYYRSLYKIH